MKVKAMNTRQILIILKERGWRISRYASSHIILKHDEADKHISIPARSKDVSLPLAQRLIKESEICLIHQIH